VAKKKKEKRGRWDNLKKNKNLKLRQDYMDTHYINGTPSITGKGQGIRKPTDEEKDWLNRFYGEYNNAAVNHDDYDEQLHNTEELVKDCYDRNNQRNRCQVNKGKAMNTVKFRSWKDLDQDTIHGDYESIDGRLEDINNRMADYDEKCKMFKKVNKAFPDLFEFDEFMSFDIDMIYERIKTQS
jgi:hypothetical protein